MGIPGLLKEIGKGERIALSKLAVEFLERNSRPLRIAIDIAIWQFQNQAGQGGQNPALRTFYYRLLRILALPIHPLFVYDGPKKPLAKRNKIVSRYGTTSLHNEMSKKLLQLFHFPYRTAPGEAEAECALLQREGIVDAVMSQDVDAVMWGSTMTLRDWSQEGTRGNKTATHVNVLRAEATKTNTKLDPDGMILVAMLSGGDYSPEGIPGFGPGLACEIARAGFGSDLLEATSTTDGEKLTEWKERLLYELETNESGHFKTKHKSVTIPADFPDKSILRYYTHPEVSSPTELQRARSELQGAWDASIDAIELREYVAHTFNWQYRAGACKFIRSLAPALLAQQLLRGQKNTAISAHDAILERRMHFVSDGMPEIRIAAVPADIIGLNIEDEEDNSEFVPTMEETAPVDEEGDGPIDSIEPEDEAPETASKISKPRKKDPWDPRNVEKMWLPETIVKLGLPNLVEEWEQKQRDMLTDPKKFIANKARKINPSAAASQKTKSIHAYFTTGKSTVPVQATMAPSPKRALKDSVVYQHDRNISPSSTHTSRKARPKVSEALPASTSLINPFTLASQSKPHTTLTEPSMLLPLNSPLKRPPANPPTKPIRRNPAPIRKSKTLPAKFDEPILISSSPPPSALPIARPTTPPPPSRAQHQETTTKNPQPSSSDPHSETNPRPSSSQLLNLTSPKKRSGRRQRNTTTTTASSSSVPSTTACRLQGRHIPLSEIFAQRSTTAVAAEDTKSMKEGEKKTAIPRDSLPGTWREVMEESDGGGMQMQQQRQRIPRVSLVDLTDL